MSSQHPGSPDGDPSWQPREWQPSDWTPAEGHDSGAGTDSQAPNPFSREGSDPSDALGSAASAASANQPDPEPGPATSPYGTDPYGRPAPQSSTAEPASSASAGDPLAGVEPYPPQDPYTQQDPYAQQSPYGQQPPYGQQDPYAQQSPYGATPYQAPATPYGNYAAYGGFSYARPHPQSTLAMVLGILGWFTCGLSGIAAIILGLKARREIDADPSRYTGRGQATAGLVLGIIGICLIVFYVILVIIGALAGGA